MRLFIIILSAFIVFSQYSFSQVEFLKNKAQQKVEQEIEEAIDEEPAQEESQPEETEEAEKETKKENPKSEEKKELKSFTKYDFVPGEQLLFFEDFSQDEIGDFPALWTTNGSGEIRNIESFQGKWLYMNSSDKVYCLMKDINLPDNFIVEFDVIPSPKEADYRVASFTFSLFEGSGEYLTDDLYPGVNGVHIQCRDDGWNVIGYKEGAGNMLSGNTQIAPLSIDQLNHVIIWVQKRRVRIYHSGQKALDLPTVLYDGFKFNRLRFSLWGESGFNYLTNLRITSAKPDTRHKLLTEGKIVSYGIYFDVNSDKLKPESYGTLNDIAKVLKENPQVKIKIIGHTDSDGDDSRNLDLSKRRANSVKEELSKTFGIDNSRIETDGKGETQSIAPNDTPENKSKNRRVEFIKL